MNVGVIGSGLIVNVFVENSKKVKDFNLYGIWGRHMEKLKQHEGFKVYTTDINKLLSDPNVDVVYVALPNSLHYEYAYKALKAGKHVMVEKPFCQNYKQAKRLVDYAKKHKLFLFETIMTLHSPDYQKAMKYIDKLGEIKMIDINFSQYSRRYQKFTEGIVLPAFDYKLAGGALMDLGVYNIHYVVDAFGLPRNVEYFANIKKKVDTSGVVVLDYGKFKASMISAKDCKTDCYALIQGDKGYIRCNTTTSRCGCFDIVLNDGKTFKIEANNDEFGGWFTMYNQFIKMYKNSDYELCYKYLEYTLAVQKVLDKARASARLEF